VKRPRKYLELLQIWVQASPTSLTKAIGKPLSTIQYHLNTLKQAGLLVTKGKPTTIRY
jgi:DNA-binding transcriptional ArsR family regulator